MISLNSFYLFENYILLFLIMCLIVLSLSKVIADKVIEYLPMQIVSLTTDFGNSDYYVASLKACMLSKVNDLNLVDICHNISPYDIVQGAFFVSNTFRDFPEKTIHIAAVQNFASILHPITTIYWFLKRKSTFSSVPIMAFFLWFSKI